MSTSRKRESLPVKGKDGKRIRLELTGEEEVVPPPPPEDIHLPHIGPEESQPPSADAELRKAVTASQKREIRKVRELLKILYEIAPVAMDNPNIYLVAKENWAEVRFNPGDKALPNILHIEQGWTDVNMLKIIGGAPSPFRIYPLSSPESRIVWACIRHRVHVSALKSCATFDIDVPEKWLHSKLKYKEFGKKGGKQYAMKIVALVAFHQTKFLGEAQYWFRPMLEELSFVITDNFFSRFLICLLVVCVDPELLEESAKVIKGSWGDTNNRGKLKQIWTNAVKTAIQKKQIKYPSTLNLLLNLFPKILK